MKYFDFTIITTGVFSLLLSSCSVNYHKNSGKKHQIIAKQYSIRDSILLHDAIICSNYRKGGWSYNSEAAEINQDSVFQIFASSLSKLLLPVDIKSSVNYHCDTSFQSNYLMKLDKIDTEQIKEFASTFSPEKIVIIPTIYIDTYDIRHTGITASSGGTVENFRRHIHIDLLVSIVSNNTIIYHRKIVMGRAGIDLDSAYDLSKLIRQKHWDKLVELTMRDYIKRLK